MANLWLKIDQRDRKGMKKNGIGLYFILQRSIIRYNKHQYLKFHIKLIVQNKIEQKNYLPVGRVVFIMTLERNQILGP